MKRKRNRAFIALVVVLVLLLVIGALRWRSQMQPTTTEPTGMSADASGAS